MATSIEIGHLREPRLEFADGFDHEDSKTGLAEFGPFGKSVSGLHPSAIKMGFVGTGDSISGAKEWIVQCGSPIESETTRAAARKVKRGSRQLALDESGANNHPTRYVKIINRDFVGFSRESPFQCEFQVNARWDKTLNHLQLARVLAMPNVERRVQALVELVDSDIESLAKTSPSPDIIVLALTPEMVEKAYTAHVEGNFYLDFRRAIKARSMQWGVPTQLLQRRTVEGKGADLQDRATRAWNFCTAQYYKAEGIPWRPTSLSAEVCFVGVSFYVGRGEDEKLTMQTSVAQAFDYMGQGLVLRGEPFQWDAERMGRTPHLTSAAARKLIADTLREYQKVRGLPPRRVVIHKSSEFWGAEHGEWNEVDGFYEGIQDVSASCDSDLVALRQTGVHLFREGTYPPLRGTHFVIEGTQHFLYTMGYVPFLETYPGSHVPEPWQIVQHHGGSAKKDLLNEVLALTKMNVNNCSFADGTPITLLFSRRIGNIMKHIPADGIVQPMYKFYM